MELDDEDNPKIDDIDTEEDLPFLKSVPSQFYRRTNDLRVQKIVVQRIFYILMSH